MFETIKRKNTLLDTVNCYILNVCDKQPLLMCELDEVIKFVHNSTSIVAACKFIREATKTNEPIMWATEFDNSAGNGFIKYVLDNNLNYTGTEKEGRGISLKAAVDIVRFIKVNMIMITE